MDVVGATHYSRSVTSITIQVQCVRSTQTACQHIKS